MKLQAAALGFRVKSGWAAVVVLTKRARAFELSDVSRVELSDPRLPETRQPYHAAMGKLETDAGKVNRRERIVRCLAQQSLANLLIGYRQRAYAIKRAAIVIGSQVDPSSHTFARMLWKVGCFGRLSMNVCAVRKFGLTFSLNAMLMPAQPRD